MKLMHTTISILKSGSVAVALATVLAACDSDSVVSLEGNQLSTPVPEDVRQIAALSALPLEFRVSVNGAITREVPVSDAEEPVSTVVILPAGQNNEIELGWYAIVGVQKVLLADFSTVVTEGTTELNVGNYNSTGARFDEDGDGRSNLSEAKDNRNLLSEFDLQVPMQEDMQGTFGGVSAYVTDDGIDPDISGDPGEPDDKSEFRLRHDGTDLVVYVCGKDKTLQGDNLPLDGQYWHDDTVFIFLDGADSDNNTYDGLDDFQLAFVRDTGEMIVSKGGNGEFCPQGACVTHNFFSNSTSCEYELLVNLPLADMNMTVGTSVGFDLEITDDDDGGLREGSSAWIGFDDRSDLNPGTFGTIRLN